MVLFKLDYYRGFSISNMGIYLDTEMKQFRHKLKCNICGISVGCKCYDTISDAILDIDEFACWCDKCSIREAVRDGDISINDIFEIIDAKSQDRIDKIIDFALSQLTDKEIKELAKEVCGFDDCCDEFIGDACNI